jgi:LysM repeat protein
MATQPGSTEKFNLERAQAVVDSIRTQFAASELKRSIDYGLDTVLITVWYADKRLKLGLSVLSVLFVLSQCAPVLQNHQSLETQAPTPEPDVTVVTIESGVSQVNLMTPEALAGSSVAQGSAHIDSNGMLVLPSSSEAQTIARTYVVQPGDSLSGIAQKLGVPRDQWERFVSEIASINKIAVPDRIEVGQNLALIFNLQSAHLEVPTPAEKTARMYTVQPGDTLIGIARQLGADIEQNYDLLDQVAELNGLPNPNWLQVGQVLNVSPFVS